MPGYLDFVPQQRFQPTLALSPDGQLVAYSSHVSGHYDLWVVPVAGGEPRRVAGFDDRTVRQIAWTPSGNELVFTADENGDEQYRLYLVALDGSGLTEIGPGADCQRFLAGSPFDPTGRFLAYTANDRDPAAQDLIVRDLETDKLRRFKPPKGVAFEAVGLSPDGRWLLSSGFRSNTDVSAYLTDLSNPDAEPTCVTSALGAGVFDPCGWAADSSGFYLLTDHWSEFTAAAFYDLTAETIRPIASPSWDVEVLDTAAGVRIWSVNEAGRSCLHADRDGTPLPLPDIPPGVISALSLAPDASLAVVLINSAARPAELAVLDLARHEFRYLTDTRPPALHVINPIAPELITYPARDGRDVHALLYRPDGPGPHPVLLSVHGGPESQERPIYARSGLYQHLLHQGIAILAPNFAGSTGYGTAHQKLIYRDWGGIDLDDLDHAIQYLRTLDWTDPNRLAVMGASYGGFAALSCLARLPYPWAAGVSICGPSNLLTLAKASPPTWKTFVATVLGDPDTCAEHLLERSPVTYADGITAPLFVIQGAHDPRVPQAESDQIVTRLRERGVEVRYDIYPDEGHGFTNRANELTAYEAISTFLHTHLLATTADRSASLHVG
ncbi:alpha/beta hydrolase family protein [Nonomuraea pusilla]|uniref:Dipeptidyl aminopeptidase/acylaminoacyl peptidase n=1 Tax=Nonomuraea pusilla TaxID=46177 RepID=A0A1H8JCB4_9ACTN|nr:S9 family peptidase [Nonomuraea pusilla]SEN78434.1 Dipeptidyl aminopeptidase/acylaminoacyl peptidase [Nonomuraea pusilla]